MDTEFLASLVSVVSLWQSTERDGNPNVCLPIVKLEGLLLHLEAIESDLIGHKLLIAELELKLQATKTVADAATFQMQANAERMDTAEMKLSVLLGED